MPARLAKVIGLALLVAILPLLAPPAHASYTFVCVCDGAAPPGMRDRALLLRYNCGYGFQPGQHGRREVVQASVILRRFLRPEVAFRVERGETDWDYVSGWRCSRQ